MLNQQNSDRSQVNKGKKRSIQLVISGGDPAKPFELLEKALNQMALFVQPPINRPRLRNIALRRDHIARALLTKPAIILADEPTGNLDSRTSEDVLALLKVTSTKFHQTTIMITHNDAIAQLADRIIRIEV